MSSSLHRRKALMSPSSVSGGFNTLDGIFGNSCDVFITDSSQGYLEVILHGSDLYIECFGSPGQHHTLAEGIDRSSADPHTLY